MIYRSHYGRARVAIEHIILLLLARVFLAAIQSRFSRVAKKTIPAVVFLRIPTTYWFLYAIIRTEFMLGVDLLILNNNLPIGNHIIFFSSP